MKKILCILSFFMIIFSSNVYALENEDDIVQTVKYYKTITYNNWDDQYYTRSLDNVGEVANTTVNNNSITYEVSEQEYNNANNVSNINANTIETTYKKMVTSIYRSGSMYEYSVNLHWKNIPSKRSYDIIGIGFPASVARATTPVFSNHYCKTLTDCFSSTGYLHHYYGNHGVGVTFELPSVNLVFLEQTLSFKVNKTSTSTLTSQRAYGDYSHATKTISLNNAKKYTVDTGGIELDSSVISYYDDISTARADWSGSW